MRATVALHNYLALGGDPTSSEGLALLNAAWGDIAGSDAFAMGNRKLSRIEQVAWTDPILTFVIERHGGTVQGSSRAELQHWTVDLRAQTADATTGGYRQLRAQRPRLDVSVVAAEVGEKITRDEDDPRLEWSADRKTVRILTAVQMTSAGHGRRDIDELLIAALAAGSSYAEAARSTRVSTSTVRRRMADVDFRRAVGAARLEVAEALRGRLLMAAPAAANTLSELSLHAESESVRLAAARSLIDVTIGRRRGFDLVEGQVVSRLSRELVEVALRHLSDEAADPYLRDIEALAGGK